jgi:predicted amidohydrolase
VRERLRVGVAQLDARPGELAANADRLARAAAETEADLLLTPELSLTGYDLRDTALSLARPVTPGEPLCGPFERLAASPGLLLAGLVERGNDDVAYNVTVLLERGVVRALHRKVYLPTYGMFDEGRYFGCGERLQPVPLPGGWLAGVLICEDFWHPSLAWLLAAAGIDVLCVAAAAPGRGVWAGGEHGDFASSESWERIARTTAQLFGIYVLLANRVGVEGGVTFAGGSLVVGPSGDVLARASSDAESVLLVQLDPDALAQARRPGFHGRDERPELVARELRRLGLA